MTHEEFIAAGYEDRSEYDCPTDILSGLYIKHIDEIGDTPVNLIYDEAVCPCWSMEYGDFSASFVANSIPEAETIARRIYAALNDNPATTALLAFLENVSFDDIACSQDVVVKSEEMAELLAAAKAEIGGAV